MRYLFNARAAMVNYIQLCYSMETNNRDPALDRKGIDSEDSGGQHKEVERIIMHATSNDILRSPWRSGRNIMTSSHLEEGTTYRERKFNDRYVVEKQGRQQRFKVGKVKSDT